MNVWQILFEVIGPIVGGLAMLVLLIVLWAKAAEESARENEIQ
jgi:hypothetical protein